MDDLSDLTCRSCDKQLAENDGNMKNCTDPCRIQGSLYSYEKLFCILTGYDIKPDEPTHFCIKCSVLLVRFFEFRIQCQIVTEKLQERLSIAQLEVEETKNETENNDFDMKEEYLDEDSATEEKLVEGVADYSTTQPIECEICKLKFYEGQRYLIHLREEHPGDVETKNTFVIGSMVKTIEISKPRVNTKFSELKQLVTQNHTEKVLKEKKSQRKSAVEYICQHCGTSWRDKTKLRNHIFSHVKPFQCDQCEEQFANRAKLRIHKQWHHAEGDIYNCANCEFQTRALPYLQRHIKRIHEQKRSKNYSCDACDLKFHSPSNLRDHMRRHSDEKNFHCDQCTASFKTKKSLQSHRAIHKEYGYACPVCLKCFLTNQQMKFHVVKNHRDYELPPPGTVMKKGYEPIWKKALNDSSRAEEIS